MENNKNQYLFVIRQLTGREIKRKYARSYLGIIWSILNPLMHMAIMSMVFSYMFKRAIILYPLYFLTGHLFWNLFSHTTTSCMSALMDNRNLLLKSKLPKRIFIVAKTYTALVNFGYDCIAYVIILLVFRIPPDVKMLFFFYDLFFSLMFAMGIGFALSVIYVFFADIRYLYSILLTLWMYLSALFYPVDRLPDFMQTIIGWNPVYVSIAFARMCVVYDTMPPLRMWLQLLLFGVNSFIIGYGIFVFFENKAIEHM